MKEIHGGMCGAHMAPRALLGKTLRAGFYWPKAVSDAEEIVRTCDNCQRMAKNSNQPALYTQMIEPTWPLERWGMEKGKWVEEMTKVVWSHNTSESRTTGFTPFRLLFAEEAVLPEEVMHGSLRTKTNGNDEAEQKAVADCVEGTWLEALNNIQRYQAETAKWRNRKVKL